MKLAEYTAERAKLEEEIASLNEQLKALDLLWRSRWNRSENEARSVIVRPPLGASSGLSVRDRVRGVAGPAPANDSTGRAQAGTWDTRARDALASLPEKFTTNDVVGIVLKRAGLESTASRVASVSSALARLKESRIVRLEVPGRGGKPSVYAKVTASGNVGGNPQRGAP